MSIKIKYLDIPDESRECTAQGRGQSFSDPGCVLTGASQTGYGTLEGGGWPLDGSRQILPDQPDGMWWSERASDEKGVFADPPVLTLCLTSPCTATGISFTFAPKTGDYCSRIAITWLRGTVVLARTEAAPEGAVWAHSQTVEDFDTVRIELLQTDRPRCFAKVERITVGLIHWFAGDEITGAELVQERDDLLAELAVDTMSVTVYDKKNRNLRPQQNQQLELYRDDRLVATQYIASSTREEGCGYHFVCQGTLGLLEDDFLGGIYEKAPLDAVLKAILDGIDYETDAVFLGQTVTGYLPVCTRRQALQQLAFSIGAVVDTAEDGRLRFLPPREAVSHTFRDSEIFQGIKMETQPRVARAEVAVHSYVPSQQQEELLREEQISGENVLFTFPAPHHSYEISGGVITDSGANHVRITAQGAVTLLGGRYVENTALHTKTDPVFRSAEQANVLSVTDATLVSRDQVEAVLSRLWQHAAMRQKLTFQCVVSHQQPGQTVTAADPWGGLVRGKVTAMQRQFSQNGQTAQITLWGRQEPAQIAEVFAGELYAGEEAAHLCS